jgi:hypothetical protein
MTLPAGFLSGTTDPTLIAADGIDVLPRAKLVLFRAGNGGSLADIPPEMRRTLDEVYAEGKTLARSRACLVWRSNLPSGPLAALADEARLFVFWFSSLGARLDEAVEGHFAAGRSLSGALLDAWGSESLEAFNESLHAAVGLAAKARGFRPIKLGPVERFSPGYGTVPVTANAELARLVEDSAAFGALGLMVSAQTGIMTPRKSTLCVLAFA